MKPKTSPHWLTVRAVHNRRKSRCLSTARIPGRRASGMCARSLRWLIFRRAYPTRGTRFRGVSCQPRYDRGADDARTGPGSRVWPVRVLHRVASAAAPVAAASAVPARQAPSQRGGPAASSRIRPVLGDASGARGGDAEADAGRNPPGHLRADRKCGKSSPPGPPPPPDTHPLHPRSCSDARALGMPPSTTASGQVIRGS
jgi:hypothetical protein